MKIAKLSGRGEIFYSIQGEGRNSGVPSVFIRTSLCNLHCIWCDTDYTWNWEGTKFQHIRDREPGYQKYRKEDQIIDLSPEEVIEEVSRYPGRNVVLTGGEPMLHQDEWIIVIDGLREIDENYTFEIETNGTIKPKVNLDKRINQYNVSPKLENSAIPKQVREKPNVLGFFSTSSKAFFKFVISRQEDVNEVLNLQRRYGFPSRRVYLMPEGTTISELNERLVFLIELCKEHGFNYSDRLHIRVFGDKRGK